MEINIKVNFMQFRGSYYVSSPLYTLAWDVLEVPNKNKSTSSKPDVT